MKLSTYRVEKMSEIEDDEALRTGFDCKRELPTETEVKHHLFHRTFCAYAFGYVPALLTETFFVTTVGLPLWGMCLLAIAWGWIAWSGYREVLFYTWIEEGTAIEVLRVSTPVRGALIAIYIAAFVVCFWISTKGDRAPAQARNDFPETRREAATHSVPNPSDRCLSITNGMPSCSPSSRTSTRSARARLSDARTSRAKRIVKIVNRRSVSADFLAA